MTIDRTIMKFTKIHPRAINPEKTDVKESGFYFRSVEDVTIESGELKVVRTGLKFDLQVGWELQIRALHLLSSSGLIMADNPATISANNKDEVFINFINMNKEPITIKMDNVMALGVVAKIPMVTVKEIADEPKVEEPLVEPTMPPDRIIKEDEPPPEPLPPDDEDPLSVPGST